MNVVLYDLTHAGFKYPRTVDLLRWGTCGRHPFSYFGHCQDGEEAGETTAAKETEEISKKTWKSEDSSRRGEVHPKKRNND